jgi:hypothetical protein
MMLALVNAVLSLSLMLRPTVSRPVCLGIKHPFGAYEQIFITCVTVMVLFLWGALSDERSGLSSVCAAGPCQRSLSRVRVLWDLRPYFTVSHLRLPFSSPPTTRRVTVEVFDPASTRVIVHLSLYRLGSDFTENTCHVSECVFIGQLPSIGHGADNIENTSSVVRMGVHRPVA